MDSERALERREAPAADVTPATEPPAGGPVPLPTRSSVPGGIHGTEMLLAVQRGAGNVAATRAATASLQRFRRPPRAFVELPAAGDPAAGLATQLERLETALLPALQQATDRVDEAGIRAAGHELLAVWSTIEGSHRAAPAETDAQPYEAARRAIVDALGPQSFAGRPLLDMTPELDASGELGSRIHDQVEATAAVARDAVALIRLLRRATDDGLTDAEQWQAVGLLRAHPNPWHTAYMRAAIAEHGLEGAFSYGFTGDAVHGLEATFGAAEWLHREHGARPGDAVGELELIPHDRMVRVLQPASPKALASVLYAHEDVGLRLLETYNRTAVSAVGADGWLPAGTELVVDPGLLSGMYRSVFQGAMSVREGLERPYLEAQPDGAAATGTTGRYVVQWPEPPRPANALFWSPTRQALQAVTLYWWVEHDPAAVAQGTVPRLQELGEKTIGPEELGKDDAAVEHRLQAPGTHMVYCDVVAHPSEPHDRVWLEVALGGMTVELRHPQVVAGLDEVTDIEWLRVEDPRRALSGGRSFAERAWMHDMDARLPLVLPGGGEEPAEPLAGDPQALLASLRAHRESLSEGDERDDVDAQIAVLERQLERGGAESMRAVEATYVAGEDRAASIQLSLFVGYDPESTIETALCLWDFTLSGPPRVYRGGGYVSMRDSLHDLLETFANDAPYPDGNVRLAIGPWTVPGDHRELVAETVTHETDGGMLIDDVLRGLSTVALVVGVVAAAFGQAEIAIPAFMVSGALAGAGALAGMYDRLEHGDFEWDLQTGMDMLDIAGAVLTLGTASAVTRPVSGVGRVTMMGRLSRGLDVIQIGVLAGVHAGEVAIAIDSGDPEKVAEALLKALGDGALFLVVHRAAAGMHGPAGGRAGGFPGPEASQPRSATAPGGEPGAEPRSVERPPTSEPGRARHEAWTDRMLEAGLAPRDPAGPGTGPPVRSGTAAEGVVDPDVALAAYDDAVARSGGREVGVFRNAETGEYAVRVGDRHGVSAPPGGRWETVLHRHPSSANVLTRRLPAPHDVQQTALDAFRADRAITEFIEFEYPDGRRGRSAYTVDPKRRRITVEWERPDGTRERHEHGSVRAYAEMYGQRTTYADPESPEYEFMMRDLDDFYGQGGGSGRTAAGAGSPGDDPFTGGELEGWEGRASGAAESGEPVRTPARDWRELTRLASDAETQQLLYADASGLRERQEAFARQLLQALGIEGGHAASHLKRTDFDAFISGVREKAGREDKGYVGVVEMPDIVRGRFDLPDQAAVIRVANALYAQTAFPVMEHVSPRRPQPEGGFGYPRYHVVVVDPQTGLPHEWQIGTQATSTLFEQTGIPIEGFELPAGMQPNLHDVDYDIFRVVQRRFRDDAAAVGIDAFCADADRLAAETGRLGAATPDFEPRLQDLHERAGRILRELVERHDAEWLLRFRH